MTREEAINRIEDHMEVHHIGEYPHIKLKEALDMALSALRPVSREQVEKGRWIFRPYEKMPWCTQAICSECGSVVENNSSRSQESGIKLFVESNPFCRRCGAPMTDEAVDMVMEKINNMEEMTNEH